MGALKTSGTGIENLYRAKCCINVDLKENAVNTAIETSILECLQQFDDNRKAEELNFVEYLATKFNASHLAASWSNLDPAHDLARFQGALQFGEDGVAYQRRIRDSEWA
jgi:hypothetical protein